MKEDVDSAARYRQRAEELRLIAEEAQDPRNEGILRGIAEDYERLALSRERIDKADRERKQSMSPEGTAERRGAQHRSRPAANTHLCQVCAG